jgi:hypothetical protein
MTKLTSLTQIGCFYVFSVTVFGFGWNPVVTFVPFLLLTLFCFSPATSFDGALACLMLAHLFD